MRPHSLPGIKFSDIRYLSNGVDGGASGAERGTSANDPVVASSGKGASMYDYPTRHTCSAASVVGSY